MDRYLIDTNILIYYFGGIVKNKKIIEILKESFNISIISKIEFLSWRKLKEDKALSEKAKKFISYANIYNLDETIADEAIILRQNYGLKTPDAIIAATAKVNNLILLTNDVKDFRKLDIKIETIKLTNIK